VEAGFAAAAAAVEVGARMRLEIMKIMSRIWRIAVKNFVKFID
jgi:hypothetical protein